MDYRVNDLVKKLEGKKKILFLTTSNRWEKSKEIPKSTALAIDIKSKLKGSDVTILDIPALKIFPCEGNISGVEGNNCGVKDSELKDKNKNPSGNHRCWASINNKEDELWKVSKELFESDAVIFFISVRWGQANAFYQKLIERLSWIENRYTSLGDDNIVEGIEAGCIVIGQNWKGEEVLNTQKEIYQFFGFNTPNELSFSWQYTPDYNDESQESYKDAPKDFSTNFEISLNKFKASKNMIKRISEF